VESDLHCGLPSNLGTQRVSRLLVGDTW
jgi:hypothetical protein